MNEVKDYKPKIETIKKLKCPKGHTLNFYIQGQYESFTVYCESCGYGYEYKKEEMET